MGTRSVHLSLPLVRALAACTRTGATDRSKCIACRSAIRNRILGIVREAQRVVSARFHIARTEIQSAFPAYGPGAGQTCLCEQAAAGARTFPVPRLNPDIPAGGIYDPTTKYSRLKTNLERNILSL